MIPRNAVKMFQYYRMVRSEYLRYSPSVATKESQPSGGERILNLVYKGTTCGVGYVLGGLLITSEAKVEASRQVAAELLEYAAKKEIRLDEIREQYLNKRI